MRDSVQLKDAEILDFPGIEIAFSMIAVASAHHYSYACWRLPKSNGWNVLIDFSEKTEKKKAQLEKSEQGFVLQPFLQSNPEETIFLKADLLFSTSDKKLSAGISFNNPIAKDLFFKEVHNLLKTGNKKVVLPASEFKKNNTVSSKQHYTTLVEQAKVAIKENRFKKVVLARSKEVETPVELDLFQVLKNIETEYINSLVSLVYTAEIGTWLTATPETLASIDRQGIFRTIALAGTQLLKEGESIQKAVWTQKEIEEQALVGRYIINCFKKIRVREYEEDGPRTVQSGNLLHLRTDYTVNTTEVNFPELGTVMLELLHPTSAVCGMPKEVTLGFINENEALERKLFSGYLGPVNIDGESHIFVNLRCARLFEGTAILYAGAGITQDSEPEKEYTETELKMEAVGRFFIKPTV